jgi:hypothetical protein
LDSKTAEPQNIHECWVVCSREIKKQAHHALTEILEKRGMYGNVQFIDGDDLWKLIKKHLPPDGIWEHLEKVQKSLVPLGRQFDIRARTTATGTSLEIHGKRAPKSQPESLAFSFNLRFPKTKKGLRKLGEFKRHFRFGSAVTLPGEYIADMKFPPELAALVPVDKRGKPDRLRLGKVSPGTSKDIRVTIKDGENDLASIDYVLLRAEQAGTELLRVSNESQNIPWTFEFDFLFKQMKAKLNLSMDIGNRNVRESLDALEFQLALAKGTDIVIFDRSTRLPILRMPILERSLGTPQAGLMSLMKHLVFIQEVTTIPILFPARDIKPIEIRAIHDTAKKLKQGVLVSSDMILNVMVNPASAKRILNTRRHVKEMAYRFEGEETQTILDTKIPMGPVILECEQVNLTRGSVTALRRLSRSSNPKKTEQIGLVPVKGNTFKISYPRWAQNAELDNKGK